MQAIRWVVISIVQLADSDVAVVTVGVVLLTGRRPHERGTALIVPVTYDRGSGLAMMGRFSPCLA